MNPRHTLEAIMRTAQHLHENWRRYEDTHALLANVSDRLGVHGGDPCDPTYAAALHSQTYLDTVAELAEALGHLRNVERQLTTTSRHDPATTRTLDAAVRAARCADPVCTDNAVKHGYCWIHFWENRRAE